MLAASICLTPAHFFTYHLHVVFFACAARTPMSSNVAIVDDRDTSIHYVGPWNQEGNSDEFDSTTTVSVTEGTTASFSFVGE